MKHFYVGAMTLSIGLLLSACGGGGSGGRSGPPGMDTTRPVPATQPTAAQVIDQIGDIGRNADRLTMTALHVWYRQGGTTFGHDCFAAARCEPATDEFGLIFTPENLSAIPRNATIRNRDSRHGVPAGSGIFRHVLNGAAIWEPDAA